MRRYLANACRTTALFLLTVCGTVAAFMILAPIVGYLPYSDRPGPGWYGLFPGISWHELGAHVVFVLEFLLVLFLPWVAVLFQLPFGVVHLMARGGAKPRVLRVVGAVLTGFITAWALAGAAWYIAMGWPPLLVGVAASLAFGASCLPRRVRQAVAA